MTENPLEARKALKTLGDAIAALETQVADLTVRERDLTAQNRGLQIRANEAQQKLSGAERCCHEQTERNKELEPQVKDLTRRLNEELTRANNAESLSGALRDKADSYDKLVGLSLKLIDAFDRLPLKASEGHPIPSDVQQEIPLYGTYEWKAVADTILALAEMIDQ